MSVSVWLSGKALMVLINVVTLRRVRLVPGWVTVLAFRTGKPPQHRRKHPGQLSMSHSSVGKHNEYPEKAGE